MTAVSAEAVEALARRAPYAESVRGFLDRDGAAVVGEVAEGMSSRTEAAQVGAWRGQVDVMKHVLSQLGMDGLIAFEFAVPRMGKRVDVLLVVGGAVFVLEFKVGERRFASEAVRQVWDYALDMKNFHSSSHGVPVVPVLIATEAEAHPTDGGSRPTGRGRAYAGGSVLTGQPTHDEPELATERSAGPKSRAVMLWYT